MPSILLTGPAIEPWSVAEAKSYLRAENDDDDTVIASLMSAARVYDSAGNASVVDAGSNSTTCSKSWRCEFRASQ